MTKTIGVFIGAVGNIQYPLFVEAARVLGLLSPQVDIEYITVRFIKEKLEGSFSNLIDYLLTKDVHFFISHPNQGMIKDWDMCIVESELLRLFDHQGFPTGNSLKCPIFLQNNFEYLHLLEHVSCVIPTLHVPLKQDDHFVNLEDQLR